MIKSIPIISGEEGEVRQGQAGDALHELDWCLDQVFEIIKKAWTRFLKSSKKLGPGL